MIFRKIFGFLIVTVVFSFLYPTILCCQSTSGIPGYVRIPTATFNRDGTFFIGTGFLPKNYLEYSKYQYDAGTAFASITFLPFVEVDFRFTRQLNYPNYKSHVSDRMPSIRIRLFNEKKWIPSVVIGVQDFLTSIESGDARHFQSSYLVVTKGVQIKPLELKIEATIGYGANWLISKNYELLGLWGGFCLNWNKIKWINLMADYDGTVISTGIEAICFQHLYIKAGVVGFNSFTGCISYHIYLKK
jgi:hypothetical protein